jgi:hypothetical protein
MLAESARKKAFDLKGWGVDYAERCRATAELRSHSSPHWRC